MSSSAPTVEEATEASTPVTVRLRGIGKRFPGVIANDDINIDVRRGTIHAIVGENGAGKSTLMKILYGVQPPDSGTIEINGAQVSLHSPADAIKAGVGMVFQHFMLADNFTVLENVVLGAEKLHGIGGDARAEVKRISDAYGLGIEPDRLVEELGVGARQRVEILKVLYRGAEIVILDEPTAVLVPQEVDELFGNLRELKEEGLSVIFISHKLDEVLSVADEITVIRRGTTVRTVQPTEVTARQLAELMVGSELPSPSTETSTVTDKVLLSVQHLGLPGLRGPPAARRHLLRHPRGRGARHRRRRGQRPGRAGRVDHGHATGRHRHRRARRQGPLQRVAPASAASPVSASSPRTGTGTACCSTRRCGRTGSSATRPGRRAPRARSSTSARHAPTPSGSSRSTTSARPARTCWPGRSPAATSRS